MHAERCRDCVPWKTSGFCKYQPDKKQSFRQDFWYFGGVGQPIEAQSKVIQCFFSCNWWKHGHYRCCATGYIHPWRILMTLWPSPRTLWSWCQWQIPQQQLIFSLPSSERWTGSECPPRLNTASAPQLLKSLLRPCWSGLVPRCQPGYRWCAINDREYADVGTKFREKVQTANGEQDFLTFHCILHLEALCCKSLKIDNVMDVVVQTVNFFWSRGLNHHQFDSLLREKDHNYGLPYHTEVRWLSRGAVLRRFFDLREEIEQLMEKRAIQC